MKMPMKKDSRSALRAATLVAFGMLAITLAGCPTPGDPADNAADGGQDGGADGGDTGGAAVFSFDGDRAARIAWNAIDLPYKLAYAGTPYPGASPDSCPRIEGSELAWTVTGGCVTASGERWEGSVSITRKPNESSVRDTFVYSTLSHVGAGWSVDVDGTIVSELKQSDCGFPGPHLLVADGLRVRLSGRFVENNGGFFPGTGDEVTLTFTEYQYGWDGVCGQVGLSASGVVDVEGAGSFRFESAFVENNSNCAGEPESGSATFTGQNQLVIQADGAQGCDKCVPWTTGDLDGQLCWPERE